MLGAPGPSGPARQGIAPEGAHVPVKDDAALNRAPRKLRMRSLMEVVALLLVLATSYEANTPVPAPALERAPLAAEAAAPSTPDATSQTWRAYARPLLNECFTAHPVSAMEAGRREFDGSLPDERPERLTKGIASMRAVKTALAARSHRSPS